MTFTSPYIPEFVFIFDTKHIHLCNEIYQASIRNIVTS